MLSNVKLLLGITDTSKDVLLTLLINQVESWIKSYINDNDITGLDDIVCNMVVYRYNRIGTEGVNGENYSGVSFNYSTDYPSEIYKSLNKHRKVGIIND